MRDGGEVFWSSGVMGYWSTGVLEWWSNGVVEHWSDGVLEYRSNEFVKIRRKRNEFMEINSDFDDCSFNVDAIIGTGGREKRGAKIWLGE
jgi:hypothetical protein